MNRTKFAELVLQNEKQLYRIARSILKNDEDCADAAQEAVAKGFACLQHLRDDRYAKTWLIRILIHECYRIRRMREKTILLSWERCSDDQSNQMPYGKLELYEALSGLPEGLRLVLVLHYLEGYKVKEIAEILHIPQGTVKSRLERARRQLRTKLENEEGWI